MSKSYKKPYCSISCSGDKLGEKDDKVRAHRATRRANNAKTLEASRSEDNEPSRPYKCKKSVEVWNFRKDGKAKVELGCPDTSIHLKKLAKGKVRMVK